MNIQSKDVKDKIALLPLDQQKEMLKLLEEYEIAKQKDSAKTDFLSFVRMMWSSFIGGDHHEIMADAFERVARGELKRLIINKPHRQTKSEFESFLFPAWLLGQYPDKKEIQTAHSAE